MTPDESFHNLVRYYTGYSFTDMMMQSLRVRPRYELWVRAMHSRLYNRQNPGVLINKACRDAVRGGMR